MAGKASPRTSWRISSSSGGSSPSQLVLGQLYSRQENYFAARAVYEHLLSRKLDPQLVADVRRQLDWVIAKTGTP
jgi:hypothetical protein